MSNEKVSPTADTSDMPICPPLLVRGEDGSLLSYHMLEPLAPGGWKVQVSALDGVGNSRNQAFITLRGADLREDAQRHLGSARVVELRVLGRDDWGDDEGDTVTVAALQLVVVSSEIAARGLVLYGYLAEPGGIDYSEYAPDTDLPYWPKNPIGALQVAERLTAPAVGRLVEVYLLPEAVQD